jgi:serine/threonine protein phosphatase PrpC
VSGHLRLTEVAHASDTGRVRSHNEDRSLAQPPLLAVADGMGGAKAGEVAAQITIETIAEDAGTVDGLRDGLIRANDRIRAAADDDPSRAGMGTTVTAALLDDRGATLMHVGDSRAYLLRDGVLRQLTDDHSIVAEMVRQGQLAPEDAERHPSRNIITRALGAEAAVRIDETSVDLRAGDLLLLCTDGLSSLVRDREIEEILHGDGALDDVAASLIAAALERGGNDNITVVLGRLGGETREATGRLPAVPAEATEPIRIPPSPDDAPAAVRSPVMLEPTSHGHGRRGRIIGLVAVVILLVGAFGAWAGSRTYFVDGTANGTVQVYHGVPFDIAGVELFSRWGDTGVAAAPAAAAGAALGRSARGQGDAVRYAVDLIWRYGLPTVPEITVPPPPPPAKPKPKRR